MNTIRILVVEDDIFISQDIVEMLAQMDYVVSGVAYDAEETSIPLLKLPYTITHNVGNQILGTPPISIVY